MKVRLYAFLCMFCTLVASALGQRSKVHELVTSIAKNSKNEVTGEVIVLPRFKVTPDPYLSEKVFYELSRRYNPPPKDFGIVALQDEFSKSSLRHSLEESAVFEFGLRGKELKELKGGFELGGMDFYLKKGLAWHPEYNPYVTWTIGKRTTWGYSYRNQHDLAAQILRNPVMYVSEKILERPVYALVRTFGW